MATQSLERELPLIVIAGPTASGKTALAVRLAERFGGEIICADSRTIYRGMDIGTAKPTRDERANVPHWGLDLVEPGGRFTVADFKAYAEQKIAEIRERGNVPFLVGGTGLYIDAIVFDFAFAGEANEVLREQLEQMNVQELQKYCENNNIKLPENDHNKRYLIRAIERKNVTVKRRETPIDNTIVVGITTNRETLRTRIALRSEQLFANNVVEEATILSKKYSWDSEAMTGNVYPLVRKYIAGELDETGLRREFEISDWRLAKRQMTWLRRNPYIMWGTIEASEHYLSRILVR
jgi:tRNA dimethylallyltransferase